MKQRQYTIGHRGAAGLAPENTLTSFRIGCQSRAAAVECDVQLTNDNQLVVIHDEKLDRTTNGHGFVRDHTVQAVTSLDGLGGEKVPTLLAVYQLVVEHRKRLMIEVKGETANQAMDVFDETLKFIDGSQARPNVEVHSFWPDVIEAASKNNIQSAFIASTFTSDAEVVEQVKSVGAHSLNLLHKLITTELISRVHRERMEIGAWPLNTYVDFHRMKNMGVNGLITDHPDRFTV